MFMTFIAALAASVFVFEVATFLMRPTQSRSVLSGPATFSSLVEERRPRSALDAILVTLFPERFDPEKAKDLTNVINLLKRAGYPYDTPGDFYVSAMRDFGLFLTVGAGLAATMMFFDMGLAGIGIAFIFIFLGLRRPYTRLKSIAKRRAKGMKTNMLIGLTVMETLVTAGIAPIEAAKSLQAIGGPFCNLMGLFVAQQARTDVMSAIEVVRDHLPDPNEMEPKLFLKDIESAYRDDGRPIGNSIAALRVSVHRTVIEDTEMRVALVKQRSSLFGIFSVMGLVLSIFLPYGGVAF